MSLHTFPLAPLPSNSNGSRRNIRDAAEVDEGEAVAEGEATGASSGKQPKPTRSRHKQTSSRCWSAENALQMTDRPRAKATQEERERDVTQDDIQADEKQHAQACDTGLIEAQRASDQDIGVVTANKNPTYRNDCGSGRRTPHTRRASRRTRYDDDEAHANRSNLTGDARAKGAWSIATGLFEPEHSQTQPSLRAEDRLHGRRAAAPAHEAPRDCRCSTPCAQHGVNKGAEVERTERAPTAAVQCSSRSRLPTENPLPQTAELMQEKHRMSNAFAKDTRPHRVARYPRRSPRRRSCCGAKPRLHP